MKYLLDTHYMIWTIMESRRISKKLIDTITDPRNEIIVSAISFWEISLKSSLGKIHLQDIEPQDLPQLCEKMNFHIEPLQANVCSSYHQLNATYHKDPFDRMLIWTAITNDYAMITADKTITKYKSEGLKIYAEK